MSVLAPKRRVDGNDVFITFRVQFEEFEIRGVRFNRDDSSVGKFSREEYRDAADVGPRVNNVPRMNSGQHLVVIFTIDKDLAEYRNIGGVGSKREGRFVTARYYCRAPMLLELQVNASTEALGE